jgi:hypothetical protein
MPPTDHQQLREAIQVTLVQRRGETANAHAIATAAIETYRDVAACLSPVVGDRGVEVLFRRALHLTSSAFPWLDLTGQDAEGAALFTVLQAHLAARDSRSAADASLALLVTFTELLSTLIGPPLTHRLLAPIWASPDLENQND